MLLLLVYIVASTLRLRLLLRYSMCRVMRSTTNIIMSTNDSERQNWKTTSKPPHSFRLRHHHANAPSPTTANVTPPPTFKTFHPKRSSSCWIS